MPHESVSIKTTLLETQLDSIYIIPLGDLHLGDDFCDYNLIQETIDFIAKEPKAYVIGTGDWLDCATRISKTSPFESTSLSNQISMCIKMFEPIKRKILGLINGNHEQRILDFCGYSPIAHICTELGIKYLGDDGIVVVRFNTSKGGYNNQVYSAYVHHTTGGGSTVGCKMNRIDSLRKIVSNCDVYIGGHNHQLGAIPVITPLFDHRKMSLKHLRQMLVDSGSYLKWGGYSKRGMMQPCKLGSPRIRLDGTRKDVHVSV